MKKFRILMGVLALAMAAIVIVACTKEKEMRSEMVENIETVSKEDDMNAYLKQFKERMQSASRGDETLSMEDARWHLEAVLNYTYGDVGRQISDIQYDTLYYNLHTDGNELTLAQLNDAFIVLSYDLEKTYENCDLPDKSILAIQTTFENKSKGDVVVKSIISTRGYIAYPFPILFDSTDYWWEDDYSGKCGPYVGTCIGEGAVQQLESKINLNTLPVACSTGHGYFTDYRNVVIGGSIMNGLTDPNSPSGYRVPYFFSAMNERTCLSPEDLNYYLEEALELIDEFKPGNYIFVSMTNTYMYAVPINYHLAYHEYNFTYGCLHCYDPGFDY